MHWLSDNHKLLLDVVLGVSGIVLAAYLVPWFFFRKGR